MTKKTTKTAPKKTLPGAEFDKPIPKGATVTQITAQYAKELAAERAHLRKERGEPAPAAKTHIPASQAKLARGLDSRAAPHSAKSVADQAGKAGPAALHKAEAKEAAKVAKEAKKVEKKTERAAKAAPKADDTRKITIVDKSFTYGREGSARRASWEACTKAKTVADYAKAGGALKYLPRWAAAGAIKLA